MSAKGLCTGWLEEITKPLYVKPEDVLLEEIRSLTLNDKSSCEIKVICPPRPHPSVALPKGVDLDVVKRRRGASAFDLNRTVARR